MTRKTRSRTGICHTFGVLAGAAIMLGATASTSFALETIRVQARATSQEVRDIPVAITAVGEETMEKFSLNDIEDVAAFTPGLELSRISSGSGVSISIRGISSSAGTLGIESSVSVIIDGVYYPQPRTIHEGLLDASQVAILKGPQALYFGKNATAGVISIVTNDPGDEFEVIGRVGFEIEAQDLTGEAILSAPINDKWGVRLALRGSKMWDGYIKNTAGPTTYTTRDAANGFAPTVWDVPAPASDWLPGERVMQGRLTLLGRPSDIFTFRLKTSFADWKQRAPSQFELFDCPTLNGIPHRNTGVGPGGIQAPVPAAAGECNKDRRQGVNPEPDTIGTSTPDLGRFGGELGEFYKSYNVSADFGFDFDWLNWQTILNWHQQTTGWAGDNDGGADSSVFASEWTRFNNYAIETRAATKFDGGINGVLGVYYQRTTRNFRQEVFFAGAQNSAADPTNEFVAYDKISGTDGETISVYGELIWDITDQLQLTGGARYIWEKKDSYFIQPYVNPAYLGLFIEGRTLADDSSFDDLIPEVTLRWQPTDELTFYVAYKQGFKSGGFDNGSIDSTLNADPIGDITFLPETVEGFEGGIKADLAGGNLRLELDAYRYKYTDLQLNFFNSTTFAYRTLNAGSARTTGVELAINWAPEQVEGLQLNGSIGYNDAHYINFTAPCYSGQSPANGCPVQPGALKNQDLSGAARNLAPKWFGNVGFDYTRPFGNGLEFGVSSNLKWKSKYSLSEFIPDAIQSGYAQIDASIRIGDVDGMWQFAIIGKNLTDKYVALNARDAPSTGGNTGTDNAFQSDRYGSLLAPRTIEFELSFRY